jgi:hypothetical protein
MTRSENLSCVEVTIVEGVGGMSHRDTKDGAQPQVKADMNVMFKVPRRTFRPLRL